MSPFHHHDVSSPNWNDKTLQRKEVGSTLPYVSSKMTHWPLSYDNVPSTAAVGSSFKHYPTSNSPVISTPYLESSVDDVFSPVCHSPFATMSPHLNHYHHLHHPHHHQNQQQSIHHLQQATDISVGPYINKEGSAKIRQELPFTGDPMELLIDKSKAVNASPAASSSDDIATPLFMPILFHDGQQQDQQQMYNPDGQSFLMGQDSMDWSCYGNGNALLFQSLDGLLETSPSPDTMMSDALHQYQSSSPSPSTSHQSPMIESVGGTSEPADKKTLEEQENTSSDNNNNSNKKKRSASKERTSSSSSTARPNAKRTKTTATDTNEKRYGCPICRRKFSRRYNLNTHIRTHNANRIKEFACDICDTGFDRKHDRDRHMSSVHYGTRSYPCTHCDAAFCRRDALARHILKSHPSS